MRMICGASLRFKSGIKQFLLPAVLAAGVFSSLAVSPAAQAAAPYATSGDCGGLPKLAKLKTPAGWCVGLVAQGLRFPRGLGLLPSGDIVVAELGGWMENRGSVVILRKAKGYAREVLFDKLSEPHGVAIGPDRKVYIGVVGGVFRFDPANPQGTREDVIGGKSGVAAIPAMGLHPLPALLFDAKGDLLVNFGSVTDNCVVSGEEPVPGAKTCKEASGPDAHGVIRRYAMRWPEGKASGFTIEAEGLRNSLGLAQHRASGTIWQAENSRDAISKRDPKLKDELVPHDELNRIVAGKHYGWPFCYDNNVAAPEFSSYDCKGKTAPVLLLPPHAAPLGLAIDNDAKLPAPFTGQMLITFHGYRKTGHRVVAYKLDAQGTPSGNPVDLIAGWEGISGVQPLGAPVDVRIADDGSVFVSEDRNGTVLRLLKP